MDVTIVGGQESVGVYDNGRGRLVVVCVCWGREVIGGSGGT